MISLVFQISAMVMASGSSAKKVRAQKLNRLIQNKHRSERRRQARVVEQDDIFRGAQRKQRDEQPAVEHGKLPRFLTQRFVRQHRAELFEDDVQVEQKKYRRENEHENRRTEKKLIRHLVVPVKKGQRPKLTRPSSFARSSALRQGRSCF